MPLLGLAELGGYGVVRSWGEVVSLVPFMAVFAVQFALYLAAVWLVAHDLAQPAPHSPSRSLQPSTFNFQPLTILVFAVAIRLVMAGAFPVLSSDLFRYVWDGRVQTAGLSPYVYPPGALELTALRDTDLWPRINRPEAVTIYPPAAQLAYRVVVALGGYRVGAFKVAVLLAEGLTLALLALLLRDVGLPLAPLILYAWHPLVVYEISSAAHLEGLMLPCLVLALWAAWRGREVTAGGALAVAALMKLFPALLLPALWYRRGWRLPVAFGVTALLLTLPYRDAGRAILTYYPTYLREQFNMGLAALLGEGLRLLGVPDPYRIVQAVLWLAALALASWQLLHPDHARLFHRGLAMVGLLTIGSQFLHPWYIVWLLPFLTVLWPVHAPLRTSDGPSSTPYPIRPTTWLAWLLFSGTVVLSYHFYLAERWNIPLTVLEYLPLYLLLLWPWLRRGWYSMS